MIKVVFAGLAAFSFLYGIGFYYAVHYVTQLLADRCIDAAWGY